jgi:hypothetical protein
LEKGKKDIAHEDYRLTWTKFAVDSLPLTSFQVGNKPCMLPNQRSKLEHARFYPTELDRLNDCTIDKVQNITYDKRY